MKFCGFLYFLGTKRSDQLSSEWNKEQIILRKCEEIQYDSAILFNSCISISQTLFQ